MIRPTTVFGIDTSRGFRTAELITGDITSLDFRAEVLVISAFAGGYHPTSGSIIGALQNRLGINVAAYERTPALELRSALGLWVSRTLEDTAPFARLLCVEMVGGALSLSEVIENVFAGLMLLAAKGIPTQTVVLPLVGAGHQRFDPAEIASALVARAKQYLHDAPTTRRLVFVEHNAEKANQLGDAIEEVLGRSKVTLPHEQLVNALRQDVMNRLQTAESLFAPDCLAIRDEWMYVLSAESVRSAEFGISARKLVELILTRLGSPQQYLAKRIRAIEESGAVAPWICGYMHVLRHLGNDSAHQILDGTKRHPSMVDASDLTAGLFCIQRLLEFWIDLPDRATVI